jgi:lipoprotein signal peptidase
MTPEQPSDATPAEELPAWRSAASWGRLVSVFAVGLALDLWTKYWSFGAVAGYPVELTREKVLDDPSFALPHHPRVEALPWDLLDFRLVLNYGAVFGIGQHRRGLFIVFTVLATAAAVLLFARGTRVRMKSSHIAIGLILAGGLGNLYDRLVFGCVRDFLHPLAGVPMIGHVVSAVAALHPAHTVAVVRHERDAVAGREARGDVHASRL